MVATAASDLLMYRAQIYNFAASLTIKFSPFIESLNIAVLKKGYQVDTDRPETWKYYLNLVGQYHESDTMMTVQSLDTRETIDFTVENLQSHTRTASAYVPGTSYYKNLCIKYPDQTDLIKSIVFPASDIDLAIDADDLTLLAYGGNLVESTEEGYLVDTLNLFLDQVGARWYYPFYLYEPYYAVTFYGQLFHRIIEMLFAARFKAIRSIHVHSWHVWQYLKSEGLEDYSDVLNRQQYMFLYRNMSYLKANMGKQSNLIILANEILSTVGVGLYGRDVYQQTLDGAAECELTPELVAIKVPTDYASIAETVPSETISEANIRMVEAGIEVDSTEEHVQSVIRQLGDTTLNILPTKLLEIRPYPRDKKYADFFNLFVMDSLAYLIQENKYAATVELYTSDSGISVDLSTKDALVLLYYAIHRANRETPVTLPTKYTCYSAFRLDNPVIPKTFSFDGYNYNIASFVDLNNFLKGVTYPKYTLDTPDEFSSAIGSLFLSSLNQIVSTRRALDTVQEKMMREIIATVCVQKTIPLTLSQYTTYDAWFASRPDVVKQFISIYDGYSDPATQYNNLADIILTQLVPLNATLEKYGNFAITDSGYARLKQLFVQLCSYNITFLDTTRDVSKYLYTVNASRYRRKLEFSASQLYPLDSTFDTYPVYSDAIEISGSDIEFTAYSDFEQMSKITSTSSLHSVPNKTNTIYWDRVVGVEKESSTINTSVILRSGISLVSVKTASEKRV